MVLDKVICPWCGAEMEINTKEFNRRHSTRMECHNSECNARGPMTKWHDTEEKAIENARAAALRRYTPLLKPMTLEEVDEHVRSNDANPLWIEDKTGYPSDEWILAATVWQMCKIMRNRDEYGKTWRCWTRKPTDEERSAAEWET